jgi:hypothetical protein
MKNIIKNKAFQTRFFFQLDYSHFIKIHIPICNIVTYRDQLNPLREAKPIQSS